MGWVGSVGVVVLDVLLDGAGLQASAVVVGAGWDRAVDRCWISGGLAVSACFFRLPEQPVLAFFAQLLGLG